MGMFLIKCKSHIIRLLNRKKKRKVILNIRCNFFHIRMKEEYVIRIEINDHILRCSKLIFFYVSCRMGRSLIWID